ncbi:MAG: hypothetical protein K0U52_01805 [Gammaproteobacteria bacterium]|nr:hypothetical protein [Gammaproteobacteria bacterium]MCH9715807.1 hypothetical protein [Gammaproteobacteria bacterium]
MVITWNGQPFSKDHHLQLPSGDRLTGCVIVHNFVQDYLHEDPMMLHHAIASVPEYQNGEPMERGALKRVCGDRPELRYRGLAIKRDKIWLQTNWDRGLLRYLYTGWSWAIADATAPIEASPCIHGVLNKLNDGMPTLFNHVIGTRYRNFGYNIGFHKDKVKDIVDDSIIVVLKTGPVGRPFEFRMARTLNEPDPQPFYAEVLSPGTAVLMTTAANEIVEHGVPVYDHQTLQEETGSLVFRNIHCSDKDAVDGYVPWSVVTTKQRAAARQKARTRARKIKQPSETSCPSDVTTCVWSYNKRGIGLVHNDTTCSKALQSYSCRTEGMSGLRVGTKIPKLAPLCRECFN